MSRFFVGQASRLPGRAEASVKRASESLALRIFARLSVLLLGLLSIAAAPAPLTEIQNANDPLRRIEARATLDTFDIRLSGEVKLTLTVEGPGPLSVTPSKPLLAKGNLWRVREDGLPVREVSGKREKWTQVFRLSPLVPGKTEIAISPLSVRAGGEADASITWKDQSLFVDVKTSIESPTVESLRPATDIEQLPPPPPIEGHSSPGWFAVVPLLLLLAGLGVFIARRKRTPLAPRDAAWAERELAASNLTPDRCAMVLRQYLAFRLSIPAEVKTTPELAGALQGEERLSSTAISEWQDLLNECDAARFSGTSAEVAGLADRARSLVSSAESLLNSTTPAPSSTS
jgi:hypothetical protein